MCAGLPASDCLARHAIVRWQVQSAQHQHNILLRSKTGRVPVAVREAWAFATAPLDAPEDVWAPWMVLAFVPSQRQALSEWATTLPRESLIAIEATPAVDEP